MYHQLEMYFGGKVVIWMDMWISMTCFQDQRECIFNGQTRNSHFESLIGHTGRLLLAEEGYLFEAEME